MLDKLYAHIDRDKIEKKQSLYTHLLKTGLEAKKIGEKVDMGNISFLTGLLHDIGKASLDFQDKIIKNSNKKVDHSSLGGLFVVKIYKSVFDEIWDSKDQSILDLRSVLEKDKLTVLDLSDYINILIYTIMSHHGQYDMVRKNEDMAYVLTSLDRLKKIEKAPYRFGESLQESLDIDDFYKEVEKFYESKEIYIKDIFCKGFLEYLEIIKKLKDSAKEYSKNKEYEALCFYKSLLIRLLVSILKSADIKDTINAYENIIVDEDLENLRQVEKRFEENINKKYASFGEPKGKLNVLRNEISEDILKRSKEDGLGIYKLDLPTGAGKTLLSLRYGINQMNYQGKDRFFYVTSFLSVLEQNASEMRKILNDDDFILEHHSNVVDDKDEIENDDRDDELDVVKKKFLLDDWTSPVILTTMVQFYNSIFKGKSANLTRFKSLINSVIILDEWQSIPTGFLYMTNLALNFMKIVMKTTLVLSTATQPTNASVSLDHKLFYGNLDGENEDIIENKNYDFSAFERVKLKIYGDINKMYGIEDIRDLVLENLDKSNLIILNTKKLVRKLYDLLENNYEDKDLYYLTTNLTASDRLKKIGEIKKRLLEGDKICVVSTQLIEAGVDVDFDLVIRSLSGMDSVVQAMGRCNREGHRQSAFTYLINLDKNEEKTSMLKGVDERKAACKAALNTSRGDLDIKKLTEEYFEKLYSNLKDDQYSDILKLLAENKKISGNFRKLNKVKKELDDEAGYLFDKERGIFFDLFQSFKVAYRDFDLIEDNNRSAIVDYEDTAEDLNKLRDLSLKLYGDDYLKNLKELKKIVKKLSRHTVALNKKDLELCDSILDGKIYILPNTYYNEKFGVSFDGFGLMSL
ncbi:CRISPR-associated helicase Cas3' [Peptoniphilus harei]|uniref:CRISPR-associated helicase Cas3' n=2 Tax=Bacillati TaxID=1783272 RepID=UPI00254E733C|nr:CRISPR-associated helicase Cas3' [Peptoniphilus harei]MDK7377995.1 CRISPR-associated helicase Cas3' [Peptoniphilus harei]MDK7680304.1 CRISPR-associated helicase Cas3' [Peptoniphilus harei]